MWHQNHEDVSMVPAVENRCIFSAHLKALWDRSGDNRASGRRFHVAGPLTAKLCCPVAVLACGTSSVPVTADRRCWWLETAVVGTQRSLERQTWTHFQTAKVVLKTTRWLTGTFKNWGDVLTLAHSRHHTSSHVLHRMKFLKVHFGHSSQRRIAVVKPTVIKSLYTRMENLSGQEALAWLQVMQL